MTYEGLISFFEFASIIIAGGLGIASTITETKDKKGKLTKWGMIALAGIIISNSFSFLQTYFQREKEARERLLAAETEKQQAIEANKRYKAQIDRLTVLVTKSDSSLKQQIDIQNKTGSVLKEVGHSVEVQNRIFKQSEILTTQQKNVAENISRTLNPLLPFKLNIDFTVKADSNSFRLIVLTKLLKEKIEEIKQRTGSVTSVNEMNLSEIEYLNKQGVIPIFPGKKSYWLKSEYKYFDDLIKLFGNVSISMSFTKDYNHLFKAINCEVSKAYLQGKNVLSNAQLLFNPETDSYSFTVEDLPVRVTSDLQVGSYSIKDLENSKFSLRIADSPGFIKKSNIVFKFPPDFSRINYLKNKGTTTNILTPYSYYNYTYETATYFIF
jgi:hypothetical protein